MSDEETEGWERMMTHHEVYDDDIGLSSLFKGFTIVSSEMNDKSWQISSTQFFSKIRRFTTEWTCLW